MSNFLRTITSSNWKLIFAVVTLALVGVTGSIVHNSNIWSSGAAQDRVFRVKEREFLKEVIEFEDFINLQSPEFPKGFKVKVKNISSKPIYYIYMVVYLQGTGQVRTQGDIRFELNYGYPKVGSVSSRLEDLEPSEQEQARRMVIKPGESALIGIDDLHGEHQRTIIQATFGSDTQYTNNVVSSVQVISHGDGTGYQLGRPYPRSGKISRGSPNRKLESPTLGIHWNI